MCFPNPSKQWNRRSGASQERNRMPGGMIANAMHMCDVHELFGRHAMSVWLDKNSRPSAQHCPINGPKVNSCPIRTEMNRQYYFLQMVWMQGRKKKPRSLTGYTTLQVTNQYADLRVTSVGTTRNQTIMSGNATFKCPSKLGNVRTRRATHNSACSRPHNTRRVQKCTAISLPGRPLMDVLGLLRRQSLSGHSESSWKHRPTTPAFANPIVPVHMGCVSCITYP